MGIDDCGLHDARRRGVAASKWSLRVTGTSVMPATLLVARRWGGTLSADDPGHPRRSSPGVVAGAEPVRRQSARPRLLVYSAFMGAFRLSR